MTIEMTMDELTVEATPYWDRPKRKGKAKTICYGGKHGRGKILHVLTDRMTTMYNEHHGQKILK